MELATKRTLAMLVLVLALGFFAAKTFADPTGATISNNATENGPTRSPDSHTADRGTITTMILSSIQQNQFWKAYVGNVTGQLTLEDAADFAIYDWASTDPTGEVYASRSGSLNFATVACADTATIAAENTFNNMTDAQIDNVNGTFNATNHSAFIVAGTAIPADNCSSQALFVSDTRQAASSSADFQEILLEETGNNLVYTSLINPDTTGFDGETYDFQIIVGESNIKAAATTYYFYLELDA